MFESARMRKQYNNNNNNNMYIGIGSAENSFARIALIIGRTGI
jgi:hypothetical protein